MLELLETARSAALAGAAEVAAASCDARAARTKSSPVDLVTEADIASGVAACSAIVDVLPDARFVVEEDEVYDLAGVARGALTDQEVWVIDPLDGTTSFVHGYPFYSISVALLRHGEPVLGVVHNIPGKETFAAARGLGATLEDNPIRVSTRARLEDALLMTGFPYDRGETLDRQLAVFSTLMRTIHGVRRDGSAALDLCHVAAGRADGFWEFGLSPWDTAAGLVILEEAGGELTDVYGRQWSHDSGTGIVAANPRLHAHLLEVVQANDPQQHPG